MTERRGGGAYRVPFAVVGFNRALKIDEWSGRAEQLGYTQEAALGRGLSELLPVTGGEASWRTLLVEVEDAAPVRLTHADGRTWEWSPTPVQGGDGVVCFGREVTAEVGARSQTELERVMLQVVLDNLPIVVAVYASDGEYLAVGGKGLEATGVTAAQLVGQNPLKLFADNPEGVRFVKLGLEGVKIPPMIVEEFGRWFENWHVQGPPGHRAKLVSVSLDVSDSRQREQELLEKIEVVQRQQQVIRELSTPIIEVWEGVLALPIIGLVDSMRTSEIMDSLLQSVGRLRARFAILDMTGVEVMDTATANHLIGMIRAVRLLGAEGIITGIHPGIAQTVVTLGVDLRDITVHATLRQALVYCIAGGRAGGKK